MRAKRIGPNVIAIPKRAETSNGAIGDGMVEIGPDHPEYDKYDKLVKDDERFLKENPEMAKYFN